MNRASVEKLKIPGYLKKFFLEEEHIIYLIRPHLMFLMKYLIRALLVALLAYFFADYFMKTAFQRENDFLFSPIFALLCFLIIFWGAFEDFSIRLLIVTNLRVIRVTKQLFSYPNKRSIFLKEIGKLKTLPYPLFSGLFGVGKLVIVPATTSIGDLDFDWTPQFETVAHQIEELLFKYKLSDQSNLSDVATSRGSLRAS